jgi:hypothetical protein
MVSVLANRARMTTVTTGTGTITLGSAVSGYQSFADAGVTDSDVVSYFIEDTGGAWEVGTGTYTASGTTLSRTVTESSNADSAINLSGSAVVTIGVRSQDLNELNTWVVQILVFDDSLNVAVSDGAGDVFFRVPSTMNGMDLIAVAATVQTAGTTGTTDVQIHNVTQAADMLSTKITIDSAETDSSTAATPAVIDAANDDVATGDVLRIDVDAVSTTAPKGLLVELQFRLP